MNDKEEIKFKVKVELLPCVIVVVNHKDRKKYKFLYELDKTPLVLSYNVIGNYETKQDNFSFYCYTESDAKELYKTINETLTDL